MRKIEYPHTYGDDGKAINFCEIYCLSTETKPEDGIATGSIAVEVNTGKVYFFNEAGTAGSKWVEQFTFQT